ncbi:hypothetical protein [Thiohalocapsa sp. ML1]|jgi:hypothetical protein|nr:hypothetical protein [Thiohalocapsa sp. ML1]
MVIFLFGVVVGIVVGWNLPQPPWAKDAQDKVTNLFKGFTGKKG